jgi:hypothetical protein
MNLYDVTVPYFSKSLASLEKWIDKAHEHAAAKKFEPSVLLQQRLAPDMFPLVRQIQSICDNAKFGCARVTGKEAPAHPDTETTWDELRTRIRSVREYVDGYKRADFEGAEQRFVAPAYLQGKGLSGVDYTVHLSLPNFNFHLVTAYAILRHNGVDVGKMDFLGTLPLRDP